MKQLTVNDHEAIKHIISTIELLRADSGLSISALSIEAELSENTLKYILRKESYPTIPDTVLENGKQIRLPHLLPYYNVDGQQQRSNMRYIKEDQLLW